MLTYRMCSELVTLFELLNSFKPSVAFHIETQSFYFLYKSNDWFLCEMRHWAKMG